MGYPSRLITAALGVFLAVSAEVKTGRQTSGQPLPSHRDAVVLLGFNRGVTPSQRASIVSAMGGILLKTIGAGTEVVYVGRARERAAIDAFKKYREVAMWNQTSFIGLMAARCQTIPSRRVNGPSRTPDKPLTALPAPPERMNDPREHGASQPVRMQS